MISLDPDAAFGKGLRQSQIEREVNADNVDIFEGLDNHSFPDNSPKNNGSLAGVLDQGVFFQNLHLLCKILGSFVQVDLFQLDRLHRVHDTSGSGYLGTVRNDRVLHQVVAVRGSPADHRLQGNGFLDSLLQGDRDLSRLHPYIERFDIQRSTLTGDPNRYSILTLRLEPAEIGIDLYVLFDYREDGFLLAPQRDSGALRVRLGYRQGGRGIHSQGNTEKAFIHGIDPVEEKQQGGGGQRDDLCRPVGKDAFEESSRFQTHLPLLPRPDIP